MPRSTTRTAIAHGALGLLLALPTAAHAVDLATLPTDTWVEMHPTYAGETNGGVLAPQTWNNKAAYDPASQRVIMCDRWVDAVHSGSIYANALLAFDPVADQVTVLKVNNYTVVAGIPCDQCYSTVALESQATDPTPVDRHPLGDFAIAPELGRIYLGQGLNQSAAYGGVFGNAVTDTWAFDLASGRWSLVSNEHSSPRLPTYPADGLMIYDPVAHALVYLVGGSGGANTWLLDPATNAWTRLEVDPSAAPVAINGNGIAYDSRRQRIVLFGGNYDDESATPTLWAYSVADNRWTRLADCPMPAAAPGFDYDVNHDVFLALIGSQTWIYDPAADAWSAIDTTMPRLGYRNRQPVAYDAAHDLFVFEGGNSGYAPAQWIVFRYAAATAAPTIIGQPADASVAAGSDATFVVVAAGSPAPRYQWQRRAPGAAGFADLADADTGVLSLGSVTLADSGASFRCVATNQAGGALSGVATLTVSDASGTTTGSTTGEGTATGGTTAGSTAGGTTTGGGTTTAGTATGSGSGAGGTATEGGTGHRTGDRHGCGVGAGYAGMAAAAVLFLRRRREP